MSIAARRAALRLSPATPTLVEVPAIEVEAPAPASVAPAVLHPPEPPPEVAIAQRPLSVPDVGHAPASGRDAPQLVRAAAPGSDDLPHGGSPRRPARGGGTAPERSEPDRRVGRADPDGSPAVLTPASYLRCTGCGTTVRRVRTPWGALAPVEGPVVGAYDSAACEERVVVVHPGGISRLVVAGSGWTGPVVSGFELHSCGGAG